MERYTGRPYEFGAAVWMTLGLMSCAPARPPVTNAMVALSVSKSSLVTQGSALTTASGSSFSLPSTLCYAVHVTGPGITSVDPSVDICGPAVGLGQMSPQAYNVGDNATISVTIGAARHFDLIGFPSPLGIVNGQAVCGTLSSNVAPTAVPNDTEMTLFINGQAVTGDPILFASGTMDVSSGDNTLALTAQPLVASALTASYLFGAPYWRKDILGGAPAACPVYVPPSSTGLIVTSGVSVVAPIAGSGGVQLKSITTAPVLTPIGGANGTNGTAVQTGLMSIENVAHH